MANRPCFISASSILSCPCLSDGYKFSGSNSSIPGRYKFSPPALERRAFSIPYMSMAADNPIQNPHQIGLTRPRPPFKSEGARPVSSNTGFIPNWIATARSHNSDDGQPTAANIAKRACLISASRYSHNCSLFFAKPKGSKPTFPAKSQSAKAGGHFKKGSALDMVMMTGCCFFVFSSSKTFDNCCCVVVVVIERGCFLLSLLFFL
mmetsp:Transcript_2161/g.2999  ORF Transcript_2161/g.2999 Transcript_2161/m.2999 type:complete len:206 (-) Transcript_2161:259-876(-)